MPHDDRPTFTLGEFRGDADFLPEVRGAGFGSWERHRPQHLGMHAHHDAWELHYLVSG
nr:hypothetical protein [Planctomycetota bacterium]